MNHKIVKLLRVSQSGIYSIRVKSEDGETRRIDMTAPVAEVVMLRAGSDVGNCIGAVFSDTDIRYAEIVAKIEEVRKEMRISIRELCEKANISTGSWARIKSGGITLDTAIALANALGLSIVVDK